MSTGRLEAFSDGVIAVAITLLVLDITVPEPSGAHSLGHALAQRWPNYAAYAISFITIGIIWINHHVMIGRLREADHSILMLNLLLLMTIGVLPFATSLMARYLREGAGEHLAAAVYAGAFLALSFAFISLQRQILLRRASLLKRELPERERRRIVRRTATGVIPYMLALALAPLSSYVTLAICAAVAAFYALPIASSPDRSVSAP
jgi:TMEM175 potassium channel family protein